MSTLDMGKAVIAKCTLRVPRFKRRLVALDGYSPPSRESSEALGTFAEPLADNALLLGVTVVLRVFLLVLRFGLLGVSTRLWT